MNAAEVDQLRHELQDARENLNGKLDLYIALVLDMCSGVITKDELKLDRADYAVRSAMNGLVGQLSRATRDQHERFWIETGVDR